MPLPQFPNVFYGRVSFHGAPAPAGMVVTAVVDIDTPTERHYTLEVIPAGRYGSGNGRKLKVGGDLQGDIANGSAVQFYVSQGPLVPATELEPAGESVFYADYSPHITRLNLSQD